MSCKICVVLLVAVVVGIILSVLNLLRMIRKSLQVRVGLCCFHVNSCGILTNNMISIGSTLCVFTKGSCNVESASADDCFIIDGAVTINLDSTSNTNEAKDTARQTIANAMGNDSLLDSSTLPEVIDVQYLDETFEDYLLHLGGGDSIACPNAPANISTKEVVVTYAYEVETAKAESSDVFLPKLEGEILKQLVGQCENEVYTLVGIKSTPDDVEVAHGKSTGATVSQNKIAFFLHCRICI